MILFQAFCRTRSDAVPPVYEEAVLEIKLLPDGAGTSYGQVEISVSGSTSGGQPYPLAKSLEQADADKQFAVEIDLANSPGAFADHGLLGLRPDGAKAKLVAVRIVVRPSDREDGHSSEHPYFALYLDWRIEAKTSGETRFSNNDSVGAGAEVDLLLTTGFSSIYPWEIAKEMGARALQLRVDLEFLAATTGWFPLPLVDLGLGLPFDMPGLRGWFGWLAGINFGVELPDWSLDLRLPASLPLGLCFERSYLTLTKGAGGHIIEARAQGLVLEWKGKEPFDYSHKDAEFSLIYADGEYTFQSVLFAAQLPGVKPEDDGRRLDISLPFGAISLSAKAARITAGLYGSGTPFNVCPELIVEMAEVELRSSFADDVLWDSKAVRLHLRGLSVLTCEVTGGKLLFDGLDSAANWLGVYRDKYKPRVPAFSGVAAEPDPDAKPDIPAFKFLDGDFDPDGYLYLLWEQDNDRLFEKLVGVVPGLSKSKSAEPRKSYYVALEAARFVAPGGSDHQVRLEWREVGAPAEVNTPVVSKKPNTGSVCAIQQPDKSWLLTLPEGNPTPAPVTKAAFRLDLPLIEVAVAEPDASTLLFYGSAGDDPSFSLLHLYRAASPVLQAKIDLNLESDEGREALPTKPKGADGGGAPPFIEMRLGSGTAHQALAVVTWKTGDSPRLMRTYQGSSQPFVPLLPAGPIAMPSADCSGCPTTPEPRRASPRLHPSRFGTPDPLAESNGWSLSIIASAGRALTSFVSELGGGDSLVSFTIDAVCYDPDAKPSTALLPPLRINTTLMVNLDTLPGSSAGTIEGKAVFAFDPGNMSLLLVEGGVFEFNAEILTKPPDWVPILGYPDEKKIAFFKAIPLFNLGIEANFFRTDRTPSQQSGQKKEEAPYLVLDLRDGRFRLTMAEGTQCILRYTLSDDALYFAVKEFALGSGGLDTEAALIPSPLKLRGLQNTFQLENAGLSIKADRLRRLSIGGSGKLPEILSDAPVRVNVTLGQPKAGGPIELEEFSCWLKSADEPIYSAGVRYRFEISGLSLRYQRDGVGSDNRHFFFEVTGFAQFAPEPGEFDGGMLENLKSARIEFTRAPLSDEFADHLVFRVELNKPVTFEIFDIFRMEIRSFGFAPKHDFPGGTPRPALIIGGQCEFADTGDVISAEIDFHRMYLGLPPPRESVPQVQFDGLRVEIRAADGFRIGGAVRVYDGPDLKGFKGDGFVQLPGFPHIGAAFAFMQIRDSKSGEWKRAWFLALEAAGISYQLAPLPVYLRQIGFGFGYRMTSVLLRKRPEGEKLQDFILFMMKAMDEHQTLARIESWVEDIDSDWTVALEAVFTLGTTQGDPFDYRAKNERELRTIVLQVLAAMNNNGLVAAAKLWFPVSYDDFLNDRSNMRKRPLAKGFLHFSPRSQRILAYATKVKNAYYGPEKDKLTELIRTVLEPVPFEAAALIEPGRVRGEIGWADRLVFPLQLGPLKLECRGGLLYAVERNTAVYGLYFSARGELGLSGSAGGGSLGLRVSAHASVFFATRLMLAQPLLKPLGGTVYAQVGIDVNVRFSVQAWFKFKVGFVKVRLNISFSITLQVLVALEIGLADGKSLGCKGRATVSIRVFGRRLRASIAVGVNESGVNTARKLVAPFMSSMLEPGKVPPVPGEIAKRANTLRAPAELSTATSAASMLAAETVPMSPEVDAKPPEPYVIAVVPVGKGQWLLWILPTAKKSRDDKIKGFYPVPPKPEADGWSMWATLSGLPANTAETKLYALDNRKFTREPNLDGTLELFCHADKEFAVEREEQSSDVLPELTLRQAVASGYMPEHPDDFPDFPFYFEEDMKKLVPPDPDGPLKIKQIHTDERIHDGPRHVDPILNLKDEYDAAVAEAIESDTEDREQSADEKARSNQSFLLTTFREDLAAFAAAHRENPMVEPGNVAASEPGLWDSGMVLLLEANELPEWVASRKSEAAPKIRFKTGEEEYEAEYAIRPLVEPEKAQFSNGRVQLSEPPVAHFDEELLALSWKLDWQGKPPQAAEGIGTTVEDFLSYYRVELYDLSGGSRPLVRKEVRPANLMVNMPKEGQPEAIVELRPRYSFTIPVAELFAKDTAGGQVLRRILAVVTPVAEAGDEGDPFTISVKQEARLTPLPADRPEVALERDRGIVSWREPALPNLGGIARTDQWELVLRRLPHVPLGQYPEAAGARAMATDAIGTELKLQPGDLIVRMSKDLLDDFRGGIPEEVMKLLEPAKEPDKDDEDGNDGSEKFYLQLPVDLRHPDVKWFDYLERAIVEEGGDSDGSHKRLIELRDSFLDKVSAARDKGHAWQLYLRSRNSSGTTSTLIKIRGSARTFDSEAKKWTNIPLFHFEWPEQVADAKLPTPRMSAGHLHVPFVDLELDGGSVHDESKEMFKGTISYLSARDEARVVSARWFGFAGDDFALSALAGFELWELREDGLTNQDIAEREAHRGAAPAKVIASFEVVDPEVAAAAPGSLAETSLWRSWTPAQRSIFEHLDKPDLPKPTSVRARDSWYSAVDSYLVWPPLDLEPATRTELKLGETEPTARKNLHPFLREVLVRLQRKLRDDGLELEVAMGSPAVKASNQLEWLERNTERLDPYGWAALWHLGLAVEIAARNPVTGLAERQVDLLQRLLSEIDEVMDEGGNRTDFERHLALDLPLQGNAGIAANIEPISLTDVALDRVQLALRPYPETREDYLEVEIPTKEVELEKARAFPVLAPVNGLAQNGFFWQLLEGSIDTIGYATVPNDGSFQGLAEIFAPGRKILVKALPSTIDTIKKFLNTLDDPDDEPPYLTKYVHSECPLSLPKREPTDSELPLQKPLDRKASIWPHGQFESLVTKSDNLERGFKLFAKYLAQAPVAPQPDEPEKTDDKLKELYRDWSARFYAAAPIGSSDKDDIFSPANISTAVPRSDSVEVLAPGLDGSYRFNRQVNWQWATTRSLEVVAVGRYDRFLASLEQVEKAPLDKKPASDPAPYYLPRIRKLELPQVLGERLVANTAADAKAAPQFHEITIALHEEDRLQQANSALQRQLEFAGIQMRFHRNFLHQAWIEQLANFVKDQPPEFKAPNLAWHKEPEFSGTDSSFLRSLPDARFGATTVLTPTEPFFYASVLELRASALEVNSDTRSFVLAVPEPGECSPEGADPVVEVERERWDAPFDDRREAWEAAWQGETDNWSGSLDRSALSIATRYPRLFESLTGGHRTLEQKKRAYGTLPDPDVALQVDAEIEGGSTPLFSLHRTKEKPNVSPPFSLKQISTELQGGAVVVEQQTDWSAGLWLKTSLRLSADKISVDHGMVDPLIADTPLARAESAKLFAAPNLPAWGRLAALAPVAMRLELAADTLIFHDPCRLAARNVRPLSGHDLDTEPAAEEIAIALRLLLDPERLGAAKEAAYPSAAPQALLRAIEEAAGVACRLVPKGDIPEPDWEALLSRVDVWGNTDSVDSKWRQLHDRPSEEISVLIAIASVWQPQVESVFGRFQKLKATEGIALRTVEQIKQAEVAARTLGNLLVTPLQAIRKLPPPSAITVWTQRGNDRRRFWGRKQE